MTNKTWIIIIIIIKNKNLSKEKLKLDNEKKFATEPAGMIFS
jgi:hypothetical protein